MVFEYIYLVIGFILLLASGSLLVKAGVSIASHLEISPLVSGITVVALGTSAPEFFVSLGAALKGSPDIAIGNVIGSNISNIALVLGVTAVILPLPVLKKTIQFDWLVMIFASFLLLLFAYTDSKIVFWEGLIMISILCWYLVYSIYHSRKSMKSQGEVCEAQYSWFISLSMITLASLGLYFGADLLVGNAQKIAVSMGVSERVIGVTIIALGTSLPELATSVIAALKKELDISVGNIIGSNIFNILGVLGVTSLIKRIAVSPSILNFDIHVMLSVSIVLLVMLLTPTRYILQRWNGLILFITYLTYTFLVFN